jgi:superfamily II DNA helicase RecQ
MYFIGGSFRGAQARLKKKTLSAAALAEQLQRLEEKRQNDEGNLERMIAYGQTALCRWRALLDYFKAEGVDAAFRCGTCDSCRDPRGLPVAIAS